MSNAEKDAPSRTGMDEKSRYVTVFHQLKDTENAEEGDRLVVHGRTLDDRYLLDEEAKDFIPIARPIAIIDVGVELTRDDVGDWCNSHAGRAVLSQYFPDIEMEDPTLPDCEEFLDEPAAETHPNRTGGE